MVSAVFHSPLDAVASQVAAPVVSRPLAPAPAAAVAAAAPGPRTRTPLDLRAFWMRVLPPFLGFGLLVLVWEIVAMKSTTGFPSPLAWLPIGLLVFKGANPAAIWTIFICSIWPMVINTAVGVQRVPQDYMNVAKVLNLSEWKIFTKILFPAVLPYMLTGVRLAVGTAWLVIVAAEMLTGGVGIGFWVWDEWNNLNVANIIIAIFVIGIVGLVLEFALIKLATAFTFEEVKS